MLCPSEGQVSAWIEVMGMTQKMEKRNPSLHLGLLPSLISVLIPPRACATCVHCAVHPAQSNENIDMHADD
jgi:hypothetical protein